MDAAPFQRTYADLTLSLSRRGAAGEDGEGNPDIVACDVRLSFSRWDDSREREPKSGEVTFDLKRLRECSTDNAAYGQLLAESLFGSKNLVEAFVEYRNTAESNNPPLMLRLRIQVERSVAELHSLRWETLLDPERLAPVSSNENVLLSRYLLSDDRRVVRLRPRQALRVLAVVANADDLEGPDAIDAEAVIRNVEEALGPDTPLDYVDAAHGHTLDAMTRVLRERVYDILYVVAHGSLGTDEVPKLVLTDEKGLVLAVTAEEFLSRLDSLYETRPRLVVLASCRSAGGGESSPDAARALGRLAPSLAASGIAAVLAMQGDISTETAGRFMRTFFAGLRAHGQLDRSVAVARSVVSSRPDSWMPALFMSLSKGNINWYTPGFYEDKPAFGKWQSLCRDIKRDYGTPILGYRFLENLIGPLSELAQTLAAKEEYPLAPHGREDLIQVAQYLAVSQSESYARWQLEESMRSALLRDYRGLEATEGATIDTLLAAASELRWPGGQGSPYRALAKFPLSIFLTTTPDSLLTRALIAEGKRPRVDLLRWSDKFDWPPATTVLHGPGQPTVPGYRPSAREPLVYHLFGHLGEPNSITLTQDDYFDYLIKVSRMIKDRQKVGRGRDIPDAPNDIPYGIPSRLVNTALLFVGFRLEDWDFRILSRSILNLEGSDRLGQYTCVAVQVEPDQNGLSDVAKARNYLQEYFIRRAQLSVYWGAAEDFIGELVEQCGL